MKNLHICLLVLTAARVCAVKQDIKDFVETEVRFQIGKINQQADICGMDHFIDGAGECVPCQPICENMSEHCKVFCPGIYAATKVVEDHLASEVYKMNETIEDLHAEINELKLQNMYMGLQIKTINSNNFIWLMMLTVLLSIFIVVVSVYTCYFVNKSRSVLSEDTKKDKEPVYGSGETAATELSEINLGSSQISCLGIEQDTYPDSSEVDAPLLSESSEVTIAPQQPTSAHQNQPNSCTRFQPISQPTSDNNHV